jgi:hypothetical protein
MDTGREVRFNRQLWDGKEKGDFVNTDGIAQGCSKKLVFGENQS